MVGMLKLSDRKFKTTMINILRTLMGKVDNTQEQMDNVSKTVEILYKNLKEILSNCFNRKMSSMDILENYIGLWKKVF